jgi:hypothetical protein
MSRNSYFRTTTLVAFAAIVALSGAGCHKKTDEDASQLLPRQLDSRVKMKPGEQVRTTNFLSGTNTPIDAAISYKEEGETGVFDYYKNDPGLGNLKSAKIFFKPAEGEKHGPLKRELDLGVDGRTADKDRVYLKNGTIVHQADRVDADTWESRDFQADGKTTIMHHRFAKRIMGWTLALDEEFWPNSSLKRVAVRQDDESGTIDEYTDDHVHVSHADIMMYGLKQTTEKYLADGKMLSERVTQTANTTIEKFVNGRIAESWKFSGRYEGLDYIKYSDSGLPVFHQNWQIKDHSKDTSKGDVKLEDYQLNSIELFDHQGIRRKNITFWGDEVGLTPVVVIERDKNASPGSPAIGYAPGVVRRYRKDGTLDAVAALDRDNKQGKETPYTEEDNIRPDDIDKALLEGKPFDQPPPPLPQGEEEDGGEYQ